MTAILPQKSWRFAQINIFDFVRVIIMRKKLISLTDKLDDYLSTAKYERKGSNFAKLNEYKNGIRKIIDNELTERQYFCLYQHYYQNQSVREISNALSISEATVYKHIRTATNKIKKFVSLYGDAYFK